MIDQLCKIYINLKQVLDLEKVKETQLRIKWDDTMVELDDFSIRLSDLTEKYGI